MYGVFFLLIGLRLVARVQLLHCCTHENQHSVLSSSLETRSMLVTNASSVIKSACSPVLAKVFCKHPWLTWEDSSCWESGSYSQTLTLTFGILKHGWYVIHFAWLFRFLIFGHYLWFQIAKVRQLIEVVDLRFHKKTSQICGFIPMFLAGK